ncbi:hypothetical protein [Chryseotalea sanaruensis]|nr:hypothetical protein [Chryseotalea sanaruensis]
MKKKVKIYSSKSGIKSKSKESPSKVTEAGLLKPGNKSVRMKISLNEEQQIQFFGALEGSPREIPILRKSLKEHLKENPQVS